MTDYTPLKTALLAAVDDFAAGKPAEAVAAPPLPVPPPPPPPAPAPAAAPSAAPAIIDRRITFLKHIPDKLQAAILDRTSQDDHTAYIQEAFDEANDRGGDKVRVEAGLFRTAATILVGSHTLLQGSGAGSKIQTLPGAWRPFAADPIFPASMFMNRRYSEAIQDEDIRFSDLHIAGDRALQAHHLITLRGVDRPKVTRVRLGETGGSCTAFLMCRDSVISDSEAYDAQNAGFDHWDQCENGKVLGCTVRDIYGQGIQFTATSSPAAPRSTTSCLIAHNTLYRIRDLGKIVLDQGWSQAISINCSDPAGTSYAWWCVSSHNHIEDCDTGLNFSGRGGQHTSDHDKFRNVVKAPIHIHDELGNGTCPDACVIDSPVFADCAYDHATRAGLITVDGGRDHSIRWAKETGSVTSNPHIVGLRPAVSGARVYPIEGNATVSAVDNKGSGTKLIAWSGF